MLIRGGRLQLPPRFASLLTSAHVDPPILRSLIKSFLRRLPGGLLGGIPRETIADCTSPEGYRELCRGLTSRERSVLEFIVRVVVEVASREAENKMGLRNLTLVLAPNLLVPVDNPGGAKSRMGVSEGAPPPRSRPLADVGMLIAADCCCC